MLEKVPVHPFVRTGRCGPTPSEAFTAAKSALWLKGTSQDDTRCAGGAGLPLLASRVSDVGCVDALCEIHVGCETLSYLPSLGVVLSPCKAATVGTGAMWH